MQKVLIFLLMSVSSGLQAKCLPDVKEAFLSIKKKGKELVIYDYFKKLPDDRSLKFDIPKSIFKLKRKLLESGISSHVQGFQIYKKGIETYYVFTGNEQGTKDNHRLGRPYLYVAQRFLDSFVIISRTKILSKSGDLQGFFHPGGIQIHDHVVAIPVETKSAGQSYIAFYNLEDPANPSPLLEKEIQRFKEFHSGSAVAWNEELLIVGRRGTKQLDFYQKENDQFTYIQNWKPSELKSLHKRGRKIWPKNAGHQALNIIKQCDGKVFMLGTVGEKKGIVPIPYRNYADLYQIDYINGKYLVSFVERREFVPKGFKRRRGMFFVRLFLADIWTLFVKNLNKIRAVKKSNLFVPNFAAGAGVYINEQNELEIWTTSYYRTKSLDTDQILLSRFSGE